MTDPKPVGFRGSSLDDLRAFPIEARREAGYQIDLQLMAQLRDHIARAGWSQAEATKLLGVTQPRVSDLMRGKINLFGLDALVNMATAAGLKVEIKLRDAA
ncbi:MAG: XRE family transcriptional regulator [Duganella sp.]